MWDPNAYAEAAQRLKVEVAAVQAVAKVESSGEALWLIAGEWKPPIRLEAHWFGKLTGYRFNDTHPGISCRKWTPALAARTREGAWAQFEEAAALDRDAAIQASSWGAFQIMGFHFSGLGFPDPEAFADTMRTPEGQIDVFARFIEVNPPILDALRRHDWTAFALHYNGPGQVDSYAGRLARAYQVLQEEA